VREVRAAVRVRYPEVDRMGVAHHMSYLAWLEIGRTEWLRAKGLPYADLEDRHGTRFPVTEVGVKYVAPAGYDDELTISTRMAGIDRLRVRFLYVVERSDGAILAEGHSVHVCTGTDGRPRRLSRDLLEKLSS
jgi:acyl-CoA thioester hydrolase